MLLDEAATLRATATMKLPGASKVFRLGPVSAKALAQKRVTLKLKLSKKLRAAIKRALAKRQKVVAAVKVTARDAAGNVSSATRKVRVKR